MASPKTPPKRTRNAHPSADTEDEESLATQIAAEAIEAGYDIQSDAATKALVNDPASSSGDEEPPEEE